MPTLSLGEEKNMVTQLLLVNLTVFILLFFTKIVYLLEGNSEIRFRVDVMNTIILPASFTSLLHAPWTLITSLFVHDNVLMAFSNLVWLWAFGTLLQRKAGYDKILPLYLFGGIAGNLLYMGCMQFIPSFHYTQFFSTLYGASGSLMALAIGTLVIMPDFRIYRGLSGGIPIWIVGVLFIVITFTTHFFTHHDLTTVPSLIGGALSGYLYMNAWKKGKDWGAGFNKIVYRITHLFHPKDQQTQLRVTK